MIKTAEVAQDHRVQHRSVGFHVPNPQHHEGNPPRSLSSDPQYAAGTYVDEKKIIYSEEEKITP